MYKFFRFGGLNVYVTLLANESILRHVVPQSTYISILCNFDKFAMYH